MQHAGIGREEPAQPLIGEMMTIDELCRYVGGARPPSSSTIYRWMAKSGFPTPIKLSHRCARWRRSDIDAWLLTRRQ
jgi:predicted DNA-binding transcriptional regulator AlpA